MTYLGVDDADRCHAYPLDRIEVRRQRRWSYQCDCSDHELSTTRHNRVMSGTRYHCRQCHAVLQPADTPAE
jgi:SprT protein